MNQGSDFICVAIATLVGLITRPTSIFSTKNASSSRTTVSRGWLKRGGVQGRNYDQLYSILLHMDYVR